MSQTYGTFLQMPVNEMAPVVSLVTECSLGFGAGFGHSCLGCAGIGLTCLLPWL